MFLFFALLALVIALPWLVRAMAKSSSNPRPRPAKAQADLPLLDFGDSGASHHTGHDCGSHDGGGFDGGCDAGH